MIHSLVWIVGHHHSGLGQGEVLRVPYSRNRIVKRQESSHTGGADLARITS